MRLESLAVDFKSAAMRLSRSTAAPNNALEAIISDAEAVESRVAAFLNAHAHQCTSTVVGVGRSANFAAAVSNCQVCAIVIAPGTPQRPPRLRVEDG